jgi:Uma2 family endonuclease
MIQAGIFAEDDRLELIDGEILTMSPIGSRHAACVRRVQRLLSQLVGDRAFVDVQNPILLDDRSEPQPDVMLLRDRPDLYAEEHPRPPDVFLVVEVAETSVAYDRQIKVPAYARSGIVEVWVVDLPAMAITIHRDPSPDGYREVMIRQGDDPIAPTAFPDMRIAAQRFLV